MVTMYFRILIFFCTFLLTDAFLDCPKHPGCKCDNVRITCDCSKSGRRSDELVIPTNINNWITEMTIEKCDSVYVPNYSITNIEFKSLRFKDIENLIISTLGITILSNVDEILFQNIGKLTSDGFALAYLTNITNLTFDSVNAAVIPENFFFEVNGVGNVVMKNCSIQTFVSKSMTIVDISSFLITDSYIGLISNYSTVLQNVGKFEIRNSYVGRWIKYGISVFGAESLSIYNNRLKSLSENFVFALKIDRVRISDNEIRLLENDALKSIQETGGKIIFTRNNISVAQPESIFMEQRAAPTTMEDNNFICSCSIDWLVNSAQNFTAKSYGMLEKNYCIDPNSMKRYPLMNLESETDVHGVCLRIKFVERNRKDIAARFNKPANNLTSSRSSGNYGNKRILNGILFKGFIPMILLTNKLCNFG